MSATALERVAPVEDVNWDLVDRPLPTDEERKAWLNEVERRTLAFRQRKAAAFEARMDRPEAATYERQKWLHARAMGESHRFHRVRECGKQAVVWLDCDTCDDTISVPAYCGNRVLCRTCRAHFKWRTRARLRGAMHGALVHARERGLFVRYRRGGAWSAKHVVLTIPHGIPDARRRVEVFRAAVQRWLRKLRRYFSKEKGIVDPVVYFGADEWTPGDDGKGHPHMHLWMLSPFIPQDRAKVWWAAALTESGYVFGRDEKLMPPFLSQSKGLGIADELCKYMVKDLSDAEDGAGQLVDAAVFALVYELYQGKRSFRTSVGFWDFGEATERASCDCCGGPLTNARLIPVDEDEWFWPQDFERWGWAQRESGSWGPRAPPS